MNGMKIEPRRLFALTLPIALYGACATEHHKLGDNDGPDGGSGATGGAGNEGGAGGEVGAGTGAAGGAGGGTGGGSGAAGGAGGTVGGSGTGGVGGRCGPVESSDRPDAGDGRACEPGSGWGELSPRPCSAPLEKVRFAFRTTRCEYTLAEAAAGIRIPYELVIEDGVTGFTPVPYPYRIGLAGLVVQESVTGGTSSYCNCDRGGPDWSCPANDGGYFSPHRTSGDGGVPVPFPGECSAIDLLPGVHPLEFGWTGRNWFGASDTVRPMGAPFPPGDYVLNVFTLPGHIDGALVQASAKFVIRLVP
jgi:hypothetical protein